MFFRKSSTDTKQDLELRNDINGLKAANYSTALTRKEKQSNVKKIKALRQRLS